MASARQIALAVIAAVLASIVCREPWPPTGRPRSVALNDLAEAAAGRPQNVGIYQRVAGANVEAACKHDHRADVQATFAWALGRIGGAGHGVWPYELHMRSTTWPISAIGNHGNVGIYQRIYVHDFAAESACRLDHRADVVRTFAWALPRQSTPAASVAPVSPPAPARQPQPQAHRDYERVRQVAEARGASPAKADAVASSVVVRGQVDAFLRGGDAGVEYGLHACDWQSDACPLAPVYVPPPPPAEPLIEAALQPAWDLMSSTWAGEILVTSERAKMLKVRVGSRDEANVPGWYRPSTHTVYINSLHLAIERQTVIASLLAHELYHAMVGVATRCGL